MSVIFVANATLCCACPVFLPHETLRGQQMLVEPILPPPSPGKDPAATPVPIGYKSPGQPAAVHSRTTCLGTLTHQAAMCDQAEILQWLLEQQFLWEIVDSSTANRTALSSAQPPGHTVLNHRCNMGRNALHYAVRCGAVECCRLLVAAIPTILHTTDTRKYTPLHLVVKINKRET